MGDPDALWLNVMNAGLGVAVLVFGLIVVVGAVRDCLRAVARRAADRSH